MATPKSLPVSSDVYLMVKKKQNEIIELSKKYVQLTDITNELIKAGMIIMKNEDIAKKLE